MAEYDNKLLDGNGLDKVFTIVKGQLATKAATSDIPTNVSELTNDASYQNATQVTNAINQAISGLTTFHFEVVQTLPATGESNVIYLVPKAGTTTGNVYVEWAWVKISSDPDTYGYEQLGDTQVDIETLTNLEIQTIWNNSVAS